MKTLTLSMLLVCLTIVFSGFASADSSCAFELNTNLTLSNQLYRALPDGMWAGKAQDGRDVVLQFHPSGSADWFTSSSSSLSGYQNYSWAVLPVGEEDAQLELTATDEAARLSFQVETDCQTLKLTGLHSGIALTLEHETAESKARHSQKERLLAAKWENTTYPFDLKSMEGAYLKYNFRTDGRFERLLGCTSRNLREAGDWWLAKDGEHLVMQFDKGETTVAKVKYLEMDEMVLQHVLHCEDQSFVTGDKDFFFNRQ